MPESEAGNDEHLCRLPVNNKLPPRLFWANHAVTEKVSPLRAWRWRLRNIEITLLHLELKLKLKYK
ncbi:MAG: hypothetical protein COA71_02600 [SAR86 cluster bacterium]|uniref:Uncharacterized protein n=1 Tax=SAR86 cluster bacterium TaxID=2030880 RepID=A0A2A5CIR6_9GAMM|nr:MAG: hypothetical protein COA71_02600 [SAR86 cluster bacterium]